LKNFKCLLDEESRANIAFPDNIDDVIVSSVEFQVESIKDAPFKVELFSIDVKIFNS
jgi:hypothetical protein